MSGKLNPLLEFGSVAAGHTDVLADKASISNRLNRAQKKKPAIRQ